MTEKKRRGPIPKKNPLTEVLQVKLTPDVVQAIKARAAHDGLEVSPWMRREITRLVQPGIEKVSK